MKRAVVTARLAGGAVAALVLAPRAAPAAVVAPGTSPSAVAGTPTCLETFPPGAERPRVEEKFPDKGKTGWVLPLELVIEHGKAETVLPGGLDTQGGGKSLDALEAAGFLLPNPKGDATPRLETTVEGERARSRLTIPLVALPRKAGRTELTLPPLPVAIARASGEVRTLCTTPHAIALDDPTANTPEAKPKGNPRPLRQLEEWTAAKHAAIGGAIALVVAALLAWLLAWWRRRPRPTPPPPPPRPPWEVALEELFDVRIAQLVQQGRYAEHFDRVSDAVRRYLGARYGFDGLETTTHEAVHALRRVNPRIEVLGEVVAFLENADLVKFAKLAPTEDECHSALGRAEEIVRRTMPATLPESQPGGGAAPPAPPIGEGRR